MSVRLTQHYGKSNVRLIKIVRGKKEHHIHEVYVDTRLWGDFDDSYFTGDNKNVVPTDTQKNIVYYLAKDHLRPDHPIELFGKVMCEYFLKQYSMVSKVKVSLRERRWTRMNITNPETKETYKHRNAFIRSDPELRTAVVEKARNSRDVSIESGITGLIVLKTNGSGFVGYPKCKLTTLPEATDRVLCTNVTATWKYDPAAVRDGRIHYCRTHSTIRNLILDRFANYYSNSVQQIVYDAGKDIIKEFPAVQDFGMTLPNIHVFHYDIGRFGKSNEDAVYNPVSEPSGHIVGRVHRSRL